MSKADDVLDTAVTALGNLTLSPSVTASIKKRKAGTITGEESTSGNLTIVVSPGAGEIVEDLTETQVLVTYPVLVELGIGGGQKLGNTTPILDWREQVRKRLHSRATWTGLTGWNRTTVQPLTQFDKTALERGGVSLSLQRFMVEVIETKEG